MQYIDQGNAISMKSVQVRRLQKKNSLFYQQSFLETEEFSHRYEKNIEELKIFKDDPNLNEFKEHFKFRNGKFYEQLEQIIKVESCLKDFAKGYEKYGFVISESGILH
ncbi:unnamed protein product [Paramecium sonneborni]|uniref:Uncharacterized protein n=1 Tax=Paramecium sonneborni TaxID=65129 RepID=A0A8S1QYA2_9CILI|nr:unnamed protein product [Paramecium sonneborni]